MSGRPQPVRADTWLSSPLSAAALQRRVRDRLEWLRCNGSDEIKHVYNVICAVSSHVVSNGITPEWYWLLIEVYGRRREQTTDDLIDAMLAAVM
jgi:hypothetical protein